MDKNEQNRNPFVLSDKIPVLQPVKELQQPFSNMVF